VTIAPDPPLEIVQELLSSAGLPTADLTPELLRNFFVRRQGDAPIGVVGLELFGDVGLLRSLAVAAGHRGRRVGGDLLRRAEAHARRRGVRSLYLLTTTAEGYFLARGYTRARRDSAPAPIRATTEFSGLCPASAAFLVKAL
jgi:amino-acid N-acetyltransferase